MNELLKTIFSAQSRKAWGSGIVAFFTSLQLAIGEGGTLSDVTQYEWLGVAIATFGAFGATYSLTNGPSPYDLFGYPTNQSDAKHIKELETELDNNRAHFNNLLAEHAKLSIKLDSLNSAPATLNTIKASDV